MRLGGAWASPFDNPPMVIPPRCLESPLERGGRAPRCRRHGKMERGCESPKTTLTPKPVEKPVVTPIGNPRISPEPVMPEACESFGGALGEARGGRA